MAAEASVGVAASAGLARATGAAFAAGLVAGLATRRAGFAADFGFAAAVFGALADAAFAALVTSAPAAALDRAGAFRAGFSVTLPVAVLSAFICAASFCTAAFAPRAGDFRVSLLAMTVHPPYCCHLILAFRAGLKKGLFPSGNV
ncbi:hypothetical protein [uncultured Paracoccus sp.]|uniref:hypothetical protein n=1 Tax=uncultured Paracoccus sp. TaxID=189685 RepID=UPI00261AA9DB|nr:hypothetical protein [uncultured Paracoccus sp.]